MNFSFFDAVRKSSESLYYCIYYDGKVAGFIKNLKPFFFYSIGRQFERGKSYELYLDPETIDRYILDYERASNDFQKSYIEHMIYMCEEDDLD